MDVARACIVESLELKLACRSKGTYWLPKGLFVLLSSIAACMSDRASCSLQGLTACADTYIGDEQAGKKGISGGQKRRVSVGLELVSDPSCIFLDEPTSGLDSEIAESIIKLLKDLASQVRRCCKHLAISLSSPSDAFISNLLKQPVFLGG